MKKNKRKSNQVKKIVMSMIIASIIIYCTCSNASTFNRTWKIHNECSNNTATLTFNANDVLRERDIDDDYSVCAWITIGSTETGWHNISGDSGDDGKIESPGELTSFINAMYSSSQNSFRFVSKNYSGSVWYGFALDRYKIAIFNNANGNGGCFAHEVGHCVGLDHNTEGKTHRIMHDPWDSSDPDALRTMNLVEYFNFGWTYYNE